MPVWVSAPQAHSRVSNINFDMQWSTMPCCGLEVQKLTQAFKSIKDLGNIFDWNFKRARTLPSLIYFSWNIYRDPLSIKKNQISKLIFDTLLAFNWLKCLGGFLHLNPTVGCQISTLIFEKKIKEGGLYKYPMKNTLRTAKFLLIFDILLWAWGAENHPGTSVC
jgi:hypothetical protein